MGTRSLTHIKDEQKTTLVTIYRQYDGYPSGMGQYLADTCGGVTIVNGYMDEDWPTAANRMGCLAASLISVLKCKNGVPRIGNVSIMPPNISDYGEEYVYTIYPGPVVELKSPNGYPRKVNYVHMTCALPGGRVLYDGPASEFNVAAHYNDEE